MNPNSFFLVDGYHGGILGHMPIGVFRDLFRSMELFPDWKLSLDLESDSFRYLKARDPESYLRLRQMVSENDARIELIAGLYSQPYFWFFNGESVIRQLELGLSDFHTHFPDVPIETYAVQESNFTSALPQILKSFGFKRGVLKNSTTWCGYINGVVDADFIDWEGPDGTTLPAVPRYASD
ncbi:MAG: alpha-mannosidase, partial [Verrucomicrobia bacterium]|nr:alpha-mannosidase [Verrucomicrobiota bacterium]